MKTKCKICKKIKKNVKPRFIGKQYVKPEPPFTQKQLIAKTLAMCNSCFKKFQKGEIEIVEKS